MALALGVYESPKKLTEKISGIISLPDSITVTNYSSGLLNEGKENQKPWANLTGVDSQLFEKFESIGQEQFCPTFKVKLKNYHGENLSTLVGSEISFSNYEVAFVLDKYKQPIGLSLVLEFADISLN